MDSVIGGVQSSFFSEQSWTDIPTGPSSRNKTVRSEIELWPFWLPASRQFSARLEKSREHWQSLHSLRLTRVRWRLARISPTVIDQQSLTSIHQYAYRRGLGRLRGMTTSQAFFIRSPEPFRLAVNILSEVQKGGEGDEPWRRVLSSSCLRDHVGWSRLSCPFMAFCTLWAEEARWSTSRNWIGLLHPPVSYHGVAHIKSIMNESQLPPDVGAAPIFSRQRLCTVHLSIRALLELMAGEPHRVECALKSPATTTRESHSDHLPHLSQSELHADKRPIRA